jgi:hypothetical protein
VSDVTMAPLRVALLQRLGEAEAAMCSANGSRNQVGTTLASHPDFYAKNPEMKRSLHRAVDRYEAAHRKARAEQRRIVKLLMAEIEGDGINGVAQQIAKLIDGMGNEGPEAEARWRKAGVLKRRLARAFATLRRWEKSATAFTIETLDARGTEIDLLCERGGRSYLDHASYYRVGRNAAAIVAHLYGCGVERRAEVEVWAAEHGLRATFPTDFPSWYYPGKTTLVVYEPMRPIA